jgi:hypothetical protein
LAFVFGTNVCATAAAAIGLARLTRGAEDPVVAGGADLHFRFACVSLFVADPENAWEVVLRSAIPCRPAAADARRAGLTYGAEKLVVAGLAFVVRGCCAVPHVVGVDNASAYIALSGEGTTVAVHTTVAEKGVTMAEMPCFLGSVPRHINNLVGVGRARREVTDLLLGGRLREYPSAESHGPGDRRREPT